MLFICDTCFRYLDERYTSVQRPQKLFSCYVLCLWFSMCFIYLSQSMLLLRTTSSSWRRSLDWNRWCGNMANRNPQIKYTKVRDRQTPLKFSVFFHIPRRLGGGLVTLKLSTEWSVSRAGPLISTAWDARWGSYSVEDCPVLEMSLRLLYDDIL